MFDIIDSFLGNCENVGFTLTPWNQNSFISHTPENRRGFQKNLKSKTFLAHNKFKQIDYELTFEIFIHK